MRKGEMVLAGDKYFVPFMGEFLDSHNYPTSNGRGWPVGSSNKYTYIRKIN